MALSAENVVGSMTPASSLSCRCVRPSASHKMRRKVQCPYETECSVSRICKARARPLAACLTRCASRSLGTASCQCRSICRVTASPAARERFATIVSIFVLELAPGAKSAPQKHLFEEVVYVLSGHGNTTIETSDGRKHSFEWGPKSLFALPLNARYQYFNSSGREHARLASTNNLALILNLFHNEAFVFDNGYDFPERQGAAKYFSGEGEFIPVRPGRNMWETNFVPDLAGFELKTWEQRGAGGSNMMFILADGTMHAHTSQMPVGTYKKAHRHGADFHVFAWTGHGFSLLWYEGEQEFVRIDWKHGWVFAPPDQMFHQHFNSAPDPARYLAVAFGSLRYPFTTDKRHVFLGMDVSVKDA